MKKKIIKIFDDAILDLRDKAKNEEKGNWLSALLLFVLVIIFTVQFLIFEPLLAMILAFIFSIGLTSAFAILVVTRDIK